MVLCFQSEQTPDSVLIHVCLPRIPALALTSLKHLEVVTLLNSFSFLRRSPPFPPAELLTFLQIFIEYLICAGQCSRPLGYIGENKQTKTSALVGFTFRWGEGGGGIIRECKKCVT